MRRKFRPRKHFAFGRKKRAAARDWAIDAQKKGFYADALPRREQNVQQASLPGVSLARSARVRSWTSKNIFVPAEKVVSYKAIHRKTDYPVKRPSPFEPKAKAAKPRAAKKTTASSVPEGIRLRRAPYSTKNLTDGDYLNLQPHKGGRIVTYRGEYLGDVRRSKKGVWKTNASNSSAPGKLGLARDLLDEYYAAGGK